MLTAGHFLMVSRTPSNSNGYPSNGTRSINNLRDVFRVLFRHKRKMLVFFSATMTLVVLGLFLMPRSYTSDARLFVRIGKESISLDPTATTSETVALQESRESEINSEIEILRSRTLLEDVVDKLGAEDVLTGVKSGGADGASKGSWLSLVWAPLNIARTALHGHISPKESAIERLSKSITITAPRRSNVIIVKSNGRSPEHAQRLLQAFVDSYADRHVKANRTHGSYDFFVDQSQILHAQLKSATEELRDAKNSARLVSIEGQRTNVEAQASSIEAAMLENERALAHSDARITSLKKALEELPAELNSATAEVPNGAADAMRAELYRLQISEKEASSRFTSLHPTVIALRKQVADTRKIFEEQDANRSQKTRSLSPVHQNAQTELTAAMALAAAQRAEQESLKSQFESVRSKIQTLNDSEFRITDLTRKTVLLEASYRTYITNREQARIDQELALGRISNVNVVQPASLIAKPSSPRGLLTLLGGFIFASAGAVLLALVSEYLDPSFKTMHQVESELGIPVLFAVPRSTRHELQHN